MTAIIRRDQQGPAKSLSQYLREIRSIPLISIEEEIVLARKIKEGDPIALSRLVKANLRFVVSIAKAYQNQGLALNDLINEGNLGLIQAAQRFDETRGYKFISYAVWWIRQGILQALQENSRMIRLPQNKIGTLSRMHKAQKVLAQELDREPTVLEIADQLEMDDRDLDRISELNRQILYLDDTIHNHYSTNLIDFIEDPESATPDANILDQSRQDELSEALESLSEKEAAIIKLYYGLENDHPQTLDEIAQRYRLTKERIRQIKERSLTKLRHTSRCRLLREHV